MFGLFGAKRPLDQYEWEWMLAGIKWLEEEFPRDEGGTSAGSLILPLAENFPPWQEPSSEYAEMLFARVKELCELSDWPTRLVSQEDSNPNPMEMAAFAGEYRWSEALGTFSIADDHDGKPYAQITYHPKQLSNPDGFVATMAHELGHYLMSTSRRCPPGGWDLHELATDLTAVWFGFGIFMANGAKSFEGFSDPANAGWQSQVSGYLNEQTMLTAMAACAKLRGEDPAEAIPHLKPYLASNYKKIVKYMDTVDFVAGIAAINLDDYGVEAISNDPEVQPAH